MEQFGSTCFGKLNNFTRKKRTQICRRPRHSEDLGKVPSDENGGYDTGSKRKEFIFNQYISRAPSSSREEEKNPHKTNKKDDGGQNGLNNKGCTEDIVAPISLRSMNKVKIINNHRGRYGDTHSLGQLEMGLGVSGHDNKIKKVKLKIGGITSTIHGSSTSNNMLENGLSTGSSRSSEPIRPRPKLILEGNSDEDEFPPSDKRRELQGISWKACSGGGSNQSSDSSMGKIHGQSEPARKSNRVPKKRRFDDDDDEEDDEIRYLEKLKISKVNVGYQNGGEPNKVQRKVSRIPKFGTVEGIMKYSNSSVSANDCKKTISNRLSSDTDYEDADEAVPDCDLESKKKPRKESIDLLMDNNREIALTTRQRALHLGKDASSPGPSLEFPNGLPPAPSRNKKEKLTEVEQQLKKVEAAQRRKAQNEKAARESEAEAIRKILGQDSNRKKREEKIKKRQEELAQERAVNALTVPPNTIRLVMGPSGTVMTFSNDMGLPSLFDSKPSSYPPPRETCAGPSCSNPYKYRDSKSKLPLCSLQCYKAIHEKVQAETV